MTDTELPDLEGARVRLEPLRDDDREPLFEWINRRELVVLSAPFETIDWEAHCAWFSTIRSRDDVVIRGVRRRSDDLLLGSCQLNAIDWRHASAQLQIRLGAGGARGYGYGREAVSLLLDLGFHHLELARIWLHVFATNVAALRCYEAVGFRREGVLEKAALIEGKRLDVVTMAKLSTEHGTRL